VEDNAQETRVCTLGGHSSSALAARKRARLTGLGSSSEGVRDDDDDDEEEFNAADAGVDVDVDDENFVGKGGAVKCGIGRAEEGEESYRRQANQTQLQRIKNGPSAAAVAIASRESATTCNRGTTVTVASSTVPPAPKSSVDAKKKTALNNRLQIMKKLGFKV
jgi:hypothetical protein